MPTPFQEDYISDRGNFRLIAVTEGLRRAYQWVGRQPVGNSEIWCRFNLQKYSNEKNASTFGVIREAGEWPRRRLRLTSTSAKSAIASQIIFDLQKPCLRLSLQTELWAVDPRSLVFDAEEPNLDLYATPHSNCAVLGRNFTRTTKFGMVTR